MVMNMKTMNTASLKSRQKLADPTSAVVAARPVGVVTGVHVCTVRVGRVLPPVALARSGVCWFIWFWIAWLIRFGPANTSRVLDPRNTALRSALGCQGPWCAPGASTPSGLARMRSGSCGATLNPVLADRNCAK
jgi:hypothetical protein